MNRKRLAALIAGAALASMAVACGGDRANTNANNTAVVTNTNNSNAYGNTNTNANTNANANANTRASYNANITREEYDKDKGRYEKEAKESGRSIGSGANDGWLWTKVRYSLLAADDLRDSTINVDVDNGVVTLSGTVADGNQKVKAVSVAKSVKDVKSVNNKLTVKGDDANNNNSKGGNANKK